MGCLDTISRQRDSQHAACCILQKLLSRSDERMLEHTMVHKNRNVSNYSGHDTNIRPCTLYYTELEMVSYCGCRGSHSSAAGAVFVVRPRHQLF